MVNFSADKELHTNKVFVLLLFCCVTLVMLISRYLSFYGFKGSDDLHYAFLSSRVLNGTYDMFFAQDIYAGRPVVIFYQALWFKLFGINDFSMSIPSISVLIVLAYVVCFKSGLPKDVRTVIIAGALVYFNPVVTRATLGNLPDAYIALIALLVFLLIKKSTDHAATKQNLQRGIVAGLLLIAGLFVKESIVLIYAGAAVVLFYYRKKISRNFFLALITTVIVGSAGYLVFYYLNTGNAFYHFVQIKNAAYFNPCSYGCFSNTYFLKRLTITVPYEAIVSNVWPLLLVVPVLVTYRHHKNPDAGFWKITLVTLFLLALYFPFSIVPYVPLCHDMRQFFFLFPFAAVLYVSCISDALVSGKSVRIISIASIIVFTAATFICYIFTPFNKWGILCCGLLGLAFMAVASGIKKIKPVILYLLIPAILWLSTAYTIFKKPHQGYAALKEMSGKIKKDSNFVSNTFYFINNDTKTHFALINQFDTAKQFINLDTIQKGFKPFIAYQQKHILDGTASMQKGWLIVSDDYVENLNPAAIKSIQVLLAQQPISYKTDKTTAYLVNDKEMLNKIMSIVNDGNTNSSCY
jgi:4-amino-4-deoxy-L-arabinose transferase-like glycosyltransferase